MRIITTFNEDMYQFSGKSMIQSLKKFMPGADVVVYDELDRDIEEVKCIKVCKIPEFERVFEENKEVIPKDFGGTAESVPGNQSWNLRWFGWFRKVVMNYHAICVDKYDGYTIFADSDTRFINSFNEEFLSRITKGRAVSFFRGDRPAIESGLVVVNGKLPEAEKFYRYFMGLFLNKEFKKLDRWDDGYVLTAAIKGCPPEWFCDFAEGQYGAIHTNSTGHTTGGQVIAVTEWNNYIEHDKGIHWKNKVVPHVKWT